MSESVSSPQEAHSLGVAISQTLNVARVCVETEREREREGKEKCRYTSTVTYAFLGIRHNYVSICLSPFHLSLYNHALSLSPFSFPSSLPPPPIARDVQGGTLIITLQ